MDYKTHSAKFLDPRDIEETIVEAANAAHKGKVDAVLIGGVAMMVHGSDRLTKDVDVACYDETLPGMMVIRPLSFGGVATMTPKGHLLDVVVRADDYRLLYVAAIDHSRDEGLALPVVTPEYLAAMKMAAGRDKDELDLKTLIKLGKLDRGLTKDIIHEHLGRYAAKAFEALCAEVDWRATRGGSFDD